MQTIAQDNIECLQQGIQLLGDLDDAAYGAPCPSCFNSRIGGHIRHNVDHYLSFLAGFRGDRIDYDHRERDARTENEAAHASEQMFHIINGLRDVSSEDLDRELDVKMDTCATSEAGAEWSRSTVRRELQFLLSHSVHHYALIAVICKLNGVKIPADFGVAPSTLRYQREQARCAR